MNQLTRFELRKIVRRKTFLAGMVILAGIAVFMAIVLVNNMQTTGVEGKFIYGTEAIQLKRQYNMQLAGPLTQESLVRVAERQQDIQSNPANLDDKGELTVEANGKYGEQDTDIQLLLMHAFSTGEEMDYNYLSDLKPEMVKDFYKSRMERVQEYVNNEARVGKLTTEEKSFFMESNRNIPKPFLFNYAMGWDNLFENLTDMFCITAFVIALSLAPVFAGEYQSRTDAILLATRFGRNKLIWAKLTAGLIVSLGLIMMGVAVYCLLMLSIFGFEGGEASIQILRFMAPVPYTVLQTFGWSVLIGCLVCLVTAALTLWLSSRMSSSFSVLTVSGLVLFGSMFLPEGWGVLRDFLPGNMAESYRMVTGYKIIQLWGTVIPVYKAVVVFSVAMLLLMLPFTYRAFRNHQVV
jgi:ABC-type transport system involved in multi-copper enzyme maturation permease subunit